MNKIFFILIFIILVSCKNEFKKSNLSLVDFGVAESYDSFLFTKSKIDTLSISLNFNFNDWAVENNSFAEIIFLDVDKNPIDNEISFLLNDLELKEPKFRVLASDENLSDIKIRITTKGLRDYNISGFILLSETDVDRINEYEINTERTEFLKWKASNKVVMNPLKKGLFLFLCATLFLLLVWFILLKKLVFRPMPNGQIVINYPQYISINTKNTREIKLGGSAYNQSFFDKVFRGKKSFKHYAVFNEPIIFQPGIRNNLKIKLPQGFVIQPTSIYLNKGTQYEIKNKDNKITFKFI